MWGLPPWTKRPGQEVEPFSEGTDWWLILKILLAVGAFLALLMWRPWGGAVLVVGFLVLVALAVGAFVFMVYTVVRVRYLCWVSPPRMVPAAVARKWERTGDFDLSADDSGDFVGPAVLQRWSFIVVFRVEGEVLEFEVPEKAYVELEEGATGLLTFRGERFLGFRPMDALSLEQQAPQRWRQGRRLPRKGSMPLSKSSAPRCR